MPKPLVPCPDCSRHVREGEARCPFCSAALPSALRAPPRTKVGIGRRARWVVSGAVTVVTLSACGAATGVGVERYDGGTEDASGEVAHDAGTAPPPDAGRDAGTDAGNFAPPYGTPPEDGGTQVFPAYGGPFPVEDAGTDDAGGGFQTLYGGPFPGE